MLALGGANARGQSLDRQLVRTDSLLQEGDFIEALQLIQTLRHEYPIEGDLLWRSAYTRVQIGERAESPAVRESFYRTALEEAYLATSEAPLQSSNQEKIRLSRLVNESADRAIELDPGHDGAYHARAR